MTTTCTRCSGSGRYSFNLKDGDVCYGCMGSGTVELTPAQVKSREAARKKSAGKQAQFAENARQSAALTARLLPTLEARFGHLVAVEGAYRWLALENEALKAFGLRKREELAERLGA